MADLAFIRKVSEQAGVDRDMAAVLTAATLRTLSQRISGGEAADLADKMPDDLRPFLLRATEPADDFSATEFIRRVTEAAGVDRDTAEIGIGAVLQAMHDVVGYKEFTDAMSQLPKEFRMLVSV